MKSWQDCPWRLQMTDFKLPHEDENSCELSHSMCLRSQCPIVKLDKKIDRLYKHLDITHLETARKLDKDIKAVMDTVGGLAEDVGRQQKEIDTLKTLVKQIEKEEECWVNKNKI